MYLGCRTTEEDVIISHCADDISVSGKSCLNTASISKHLQLREGIQGREEGVLLFACAFVPVCIIIPNLISINKYNSSGHRRVLVTLGKREIQAEEQDKHPSLKTCLAVE